MSLEPYYEKIKYEKIGGYRMKAVLGFIKKSTPKILDIGCSTGLMGEKIKNKKNAYIIGIEISNEAAVEARKKLDNVFLIDLTKGKVDLPKEILDINFDYIILSEVLEHLFNPEEFLENVKMLMFDKTEIIITVPNLLFWRNRLNILLGRFDYTDNGLMDRGHIHIFTWVSLNRIIKNSGFKINEVNNHIPTRGTKWLGKIFPGLFSYQFIVKVTKK